MLYNDVFARPTQINHPDGGQITYTYNDSPYNLSTPSPAVTTTTKLTSTINLVTTTAYDGLGHRVETIMNSDPEGTDYTVTSYDGLGRPYQVSNPYRSTTSPTDGITTYIYDALGRIVTVAEPDGSSRASSYSGNTVTITDEAGKKTKTQVDALGRMTSVWEDPWGVSYFTGYFYDALTVAS